MADRENASEESIPMHPIGRQADDGMTPGRSPQSVPDEVLDLLNQFEAHRSQRIADAMLSSADFEGSHAERVERRGEEEAVLRGLYDLAFQDSMRLASEEHPCVGEPCMACSLAKTAQQMCDRVVFDLRRLEREAQLDQQDLRRVIRFQARFWTLARLEALAVEKRMEAVLPLVGVLKQLNGVEEAGAA